MIAMWLMSEITKKGLEVLEVVDTAYIYLFFLVFESKYKVGNTIRNF